MTGVQTCALPISSGTGSYELEFDHYEQLHGKGAEDVIAEAKKAREEAEAAK